MRVIELKKFGLRAQCAICETPLVMTGGQSRPPFLCADCELKWGDKTGEEWLAYLIREERKRRNRNWRENEVEYIP